MQSVALTGRIVLTEHDAHGRLIITHLYPRTETAHRITTQDPHIDGPSTFESGRIVAVHADSLGCPCCDLAEIDIEWGEHRSPERLAIDAEQWDTAAGHRTL